MRFIVFPLKPNTPTGNHVKTSLLKTVICGDTMNTPTTFHVWEKRAGDQPVAHLIKRFTENSHFVHDKAIQLEKQNLLLHNTCAELKAPQLFATLKTAF